MDSSHIPPSLILNDIVQLLSTGDCIRLCTLSKQILPMIECHGNKLNRAFESLLGSSIGECIRTQKLNNNGERIIHCLIHFYPNGRTKMWRILMNDRQLEATTFQKLEDTEGNKCFYLRRID